jgi:hypothetical protein
MLANQPIENISRIRSISLLSLRFIGTIRLFRCILLG